jgi:hypothetical protein
MNKYIVFFVLTVCQYIMDRSTSICYSNSGEILLFIHHIFAIYLYLGAFFFDPFIHLIVVVSVLFHWYTYEKCILTEYTNIYCGVDIDRPFNDYIRMLKIYKFIPKIHWILLFVLIFYDLCLIID